MKSWLCRSAIPAFLAMAAVAPLSCAPSHEMVLELKGSVLYRKPKISAVDFSIVDSRGTGGTVLVKVTMSGDPGLQATFDIAPGIVDRHPMAETADGSYAGELALPPDLLGGPFSIIGRLRHDKAGEVILRDQTPLSIPLAR